MPTRLAPVALLQCMTAEGCYHDDTEIKQHFMTSSSLTLMHVSPAANSTAVVIRERHAFVWETDGSDERGSPHTAPVLLLQFDQNWQTETQQRTRGEVKLTKQVADVETPSSNENSHTQQ